jgi:hypothetical protein
VPTKQHPWEAAEAIAKRVDDARKSALLGGGQARIEAQNKKVPLQAFFRSLVCGSPGPCTTAHLWCL